MRTSRQNKSVSSWSKAERAPAASRFCWKTSSTSRCVRWRTSTGSSPSYSTSSRASVSAGIKHIEADFAFPGEAHVAAVHQVAGRRLRGQDFAEGAGGLVQALEQQQDHAAMPRQRLRGQGRLGDQAERPFRARRQPRQIQRVLAKDVGEVVAAAFQRALGLVPADHVGVVAAGVQPGG